MLEITNVSKQYAGHRGVSSVNLKLGQGEVVGLFGENGAGKTTLIRIICGLQSPTSGGFSIYGVPSAGRINSARTDRKSVV